MGEGYKAKGPRLHTGRYQTAGGGRTSGGSERSERPLHVGRPLILLGTGGVKHPVGVGRPMFWFGIGGTGFPVSIGRPVPGTC